MAKQAKPKKVKANPNSVNRREMIHMDYLNVYNEVLKHDEVLDIDIDVILTVTKDVLAEELSLSKLSTAPDAFELEGLKDKILDKLNDLVSEKSKIIDIINEAKKFVGDEGVLKVGPQGLNGTLKVNGTIAL